LLIVWRQQVPIPAIISQIHTDGKLLENSIQSVNASSFRGTSVFEEDNL